MTNFANPSFIPVALAFSSLALIFLSRTRTTTNSERANTPEYKNIHLNGDIAEKFAIQLGMPQVSDPTEYHVSAKQGYDHETITARFSGGFRTMTAYSDGKLIVKDGVTEQGSKTQTIFHPNGTKLTTTYSFNDSSIGQTKTTTETIKPSESLGIWINAKVQIAHCLSA